MAAKTEIQFGILTILDFETGLSGLEYPIQVTPNRGWGVRKLALEEAIYHSSAKLRPQKRGISGAPRGKVSRVL